MPVAVQTLRETKMRMQADEMAQVPGSVKYLQWDGHGIPGHATPEDVEERHGIPGAGAPLPVDPKAEAPLKGMVAQEDPQ